MYSKHTKPKDLSSRMWLHDMSFPLGAPTPKSVLFPQNDVHFSQNFSSDVFQQFKTKGKSVKHRKFQCHNWTLLTQELILQLFVSFFLLHLVWISGNTCINTALSLSVYVHRTCMRYVLTGSFYDTVL